MKGNLNTSNIHRLPAFRELGGKVILAGAGPGDPELLTMKTFRYLRQADVVITDRLVSEVILQEYTKKDALIISVGKQSGKDASTPQPVINQLLLDYALRGKLVVRLKGGDVSIFSNILDELQILSENHIPYEIIPGITAAAGAAACAGIPLTARGYATAVRFLTCYRDNLLDETYWQELARTDDTLVFYMSSAPLDQLVEKLVHNKIAAEKWLAVIEQATTPLQQIHNYPVHEHLISHKDKTYASPTLIIIGKVASLYKDFQWMTNSRSAAHYFTPVETTPLKKEKIS